MDKASNSAGLLAKDVPILAGQLRMEQLDSSLGPQVKVFPQVDLGETALSEQADQAIVAQLLSGAISHR
jgi:hypothetical protein